MDFDAQIMRSLAMRRSLFLTCTGYLLLPIIFSFFSFFSKKKNTFYHDLIIQEINKPQQNL